MTSIGQDLATIRIHLNLTLEDLHRETRIPVDTLKRIDNGTLFEDPDENETYIRSFVRTYAKALKIEEKLVLECLDLQKAGTYERQLLSAYPKISGRGNAPLPLSSKAPDTSPLQNRPDKQEMESESGTEKKPVSQAGGSESGAKQHEDNPGADSKAEKNPNSSPAESFIPKKKESGAGSEKNPDPEPAPGAGSQPPPTARARNVDWAEMGHQFKTMKEKRVPVWIIGAAVIIIVTLASLYFIINSDLFTGDNNVAGNNPSSSAVTEPAEESANLALSLAEEEPAPVLDDVLYLTVYAAYDKLEPVRVWSDMKPQVDPYWMEQGTAFNFEFSDTIRIRGQYSNMLLFLNGNRIDNARQNHFNQDENSIELTRDLFDTDERWATQIPLELPSDAVEPDTLQPNPSF